MTREQVQALRDAGISEQAIIDRILGEPEGTDSPSGPEKGQLEPSKPAEQVNVPTDKQDAILEAIERLTGAIQTANMRTGRETQKKQSVEDIMASVLMPRK